MRIKEITEALASTAYDPDAGFLRNVGRAGMDRFVRGQLGIGAYDDEELEKRKQRDLDRENQQQTDQTQAAVQQAAQEIDQAEIPAADAAPQTDASNIQSVAQQRTATTVPNYAQTNRTRYGATTNAPALPVPATTAAVDPAKPAQVYRFDGRALNPNNPRDANIIKQLQAAGVTSARSGIPRTK
jgi:single-stranded DNA-binding protein